MELFINRNGVLSKMTQDEEEEYAQLKEEVPAEEPTQQDRIEAQVMYTALMTDTLLEESEEE